MLDFGEGFHIIFSFIIFFFSVQVSLSSALIKILPKVAVKLDKIMQTSAKV